MIKDFKTSLGQTVYMTELYDYLELDKSQYSRFVKKELLQNSYCELDRDYLTIVSSEQKGRGQFRTEYFIHINFAKKICMISKSKKGNEIREELIKLTKKVESLELISVKQAAFAFKVINCLKFITNQMEAYNIHKKSFVENNSNSHYVYAEFAKYRAKIIGWDKEKTNEAIEKFLSENIGYPKEKLRKANMPTQLSVMDIGEAIRVAVLDILYSSNEDTDFADKFSILCKNLAKEMEVQPEKENKKNLFKEPETIESIKKLELPK